MKHDYFQTVVLYFCFTIIIITVLQKSFNIPQLLFSPKSEDEKTVFSKSKKDFMASLATTSAIVEWIPMEETDTMSCATKSQVPILPAFYQQLFV